MKTIKTNRKFQTLVFAVVAQQTRTDCYWCGKSLKTCEFCYGTGRYKDKSCLTCNGCGQICPPHGADWE